VISVNNFKVDEAASTPFPDEASPVANQETRATPSQAQAAAAATTALRTSTANVDSTLNARALEVAELRQQGIEVDDDNELPRMPLLHGMFRRDFRPADVVVV
jgi:hypothetical protein